MGFREEIATLTTRVATQFKTVGTLTGALASLTTTDKSSLVAAINEVRAGIAGAGATIDDVTASSITVYSSTKTNAQIAAATAALVASSPTALDTLNELAAALGNDPNFATTIGTALGSRVRFDASQTLTGPEQTQARANIGAGTSSLVLGTTAGTAAAGNDGRLSDARTPLAHTHTLANISDASSVGRTLVAAADASAMRAITGAGTSNLVIGVTGGTAADAGTLATSLAGKSNTGHTHTGAEVAAGTTSALGTLQLATPAQTTTGTDATLATTPAGVKTVTDTLATKTEIGTATNFVATFEAALL